MSQITALPTTGANDVRIESPVAEATKGVHGGYNNWCAVEGFFDGDGTVYASPQKDILAIRLEFADNWLPQIRQLQAFINSKEITTGKIWKAKTNAYCFVVASQSGVVNAASKMLEARGLSLQET